MESMVVIERLENGDISAENAISLLKNGSEIPEGRGRFLKVNVTGDGRHVNITLPIFLISASFSLARFAIKFIPEVDEDNEARKTLKVFKQLNGNDIKALTDSFRMCKGINFVEVHGNDSDVSIRVV